MPDTAPGYVAFHYAILNPARIGELGPLSRPILDEHGGEIVIAGPARTVGGESRYTHMVVYRFASLGAARAFYDCDAMRALAPLRDELIAGVATIVEGFDGG